MSEVALFDVEPGTPPERVKTPVAKTFRRFEPDQVLLLPPSLDEWLPADHLAGSLPSWSTGCSTCPGSTRTTPRRGGIRRAGRTGRPVVSAR